MYLRLILPSILNSKCTKYCLAAGLRPDPLFYRKLTALPRPLAELRRAILLREGVWKGMEEGEERELRRGKRKWTGRGHLLLWILDTPLSAL